MADFRADIIVITALPMELEMFREVWAARVSSGMKAFRELGAGGPMVYRGALACSDGQQTLMVYATHQPTSGGAAASTTTRDMINRYRPKYAALLGIAAGFKDWNEMRLRDVLIADVVLQHDAGRYIGARHYPESRTNRIDLELRNAFNSFRPQGTYRTHIGLMGTGPAVVMSAAHMKALRKRLPMLIGLEMEGWGFFEAASNSASPRPSAMLIKGVSDFGTEDKHGDPRQDAARNSADYFIQFSRDKLKPTLVELDPWTSDQDERDRMVARVAAAIKDEEEEIRFITMVGGSFLTSRNEPAPVHQAFWAALERGVRVRGIMLQPDSYEAAIRAGAESPKLGEAGMLVAHSKGVDSRFADNPPSSNSPLELKRTRVGLGFNLWLFKDRARIEPHHFGREEEDRVDRHGNPAAHNERVERALCQFSHVWCRPPSPEYEFVEDHFEYLWNLPSEPGQGWDPPPNVIMWPRK